MDMGLAAYQVKKNRAPL